MNACGVRFLLFRRACRSDFQVLTGCVNSRKCQKHNFNKLCRLIFDPFDTEKPKKERLMWQKGVLIFHLAVVAGLFGYEVGSSDATKGFIDGWNGN